MSFLFEGLILEAKEDALAFLKQKYGSEMEPSVIDYFFQNDPTSDKKYTKWLIENYIFDKDKIKPDGQMTVPEFMIEKVVLYNNSRRNLPQQLNDFKKFSFIDLMIKIAEFYKSKREQEFPEAAKEGSKLIWQNNNFELYHITNKAASCHYGKGTKWCISRQDEDHFNTYSNAGCVFFFLIFKNKVIAGQNYKHAIVISERGKPPVAQKNSIIEWRNPEQTKQYSFDELSKEDFLTIINEIKKTGINIVVGKQKKTFVNKKTEDLETRFYENGILSNSEGPARVAYYDESPESVRIKEFYLNGNPNPNEEDGFYIFEYDKSGRIIYAKRNPSESNELTKAKTIDIDYTLHTELQFFEKSITNKDKEYSIRKAIYYKENDVLSYDVVIQIRKLYESPENQEIEDNNGTSISIFYALYSYGNLTFKKKIWGYFEHTYYPEKREIKLSEQEFFSEKDIQELFKILPKEEVFYIPKEPEIYTDKTIFEIKKQNLNESFLAMFGSIIELAIKRMFGFDIPNISFKGHPTDVQRLAKTLASEKRYIDSYLRLKLNDPEVIQNKFRLEKAIYDFERETGIPWPIR